MIFVKTISSFFTSHKIMKSESVIFNLILFGISNESIDSFMISVILFSDKFNGVIRTKFKTSSI
ncbi:hypothetical protein D3C83_148120 [compost metagenome]